MNKLGVGAIHADVWEEHSSDDSLLPVVLDVGGQRFTPLLVDALVFFIERLFPRCYKGKGAAPTTRGGGEPSSARGRFCTGIGREAT